MTWRWGSKQPSHSRKDSPGLLGGAWVKLLILAIVLTAIALAVVLYVRH